jgi:nucleotide-binding universal stress UspA family protein
MKRFSNILFVVTSDADVSASFEKTIELAENNQARITLAGIIDASLEAKVDLISGNSPLLESMVEIKKQQLQDLVDGSNLRKLDCEIKVLVGIGFMEIIREVIEFQRDLLIKSINQTESIGQKLLGGMDMKILRKCPCPVWSIKSTQQQGFREILVGLDYQPDNVEAEKLNAQLLTMASSLAIAEFSELHVVHAWKLEYENFYRSARSGMSELEIDQLVEKEENVRRQWLDRMIEKYCYAQEQQTANYLRPRIHLVKGRGRDVVLDCAKALGAELLVLGTVCRTGIEGFVIGNTAEEILNRIDTSILAVKPEGFISPVK